MAINMYKLRPEILKFLENNKITNFTEVQNKVIPSILKNKSVMVESPTGTGKTFAFLLPNLTKIDTNLNKVQYIIFVPTRELGKQIYNVLQDIKEFMDFSVLSAVGGEDIKRQFNKANNGSQVIVATPDRFQRLINETKVDLKDVKFISIDEVDMILQFGFMPSITEALENRIPPNQVFSMFSATFSIELQNWVAKVVKGGASRVRITASEEEKVNYTVKYDDGRIDEKLVNLIKSDKFNPFFSLIFCKKNEETIKVWQILKDEGIKNIAYLNKDMPQREINQIIKKINNMELEYLVATDKLARGMDFPGVSHIVNYTLPTDLSYYKHRIGRTDREGGTQGTVFTLFTDNDQDRMSVISKKFNIKWEKLKLK